MKKLVVIAAIISVWALAGVAMFPLSAQDARPAAPPNNCISIPASAFQEHENTYDFYREDELRMTVSGGQWYAPVNLPHGATIRKVLLICYDNHTTSNMVLKMFRQTRNHTSYEIAYVASNGSSTDYRMFGTTAVSPRFVNNFKNTYYLDLYMSSNYNYFQLSQVKVYFDAP